jgi:hypothetical protein
MQLGKNTEAKEVEALVEAVRPLFVGKSPQVQGAALADLLAIWLAGHVIGDDPSATERIREEMLEAHLIAVRALTPINYETQIEPQLKPKH